MEIKPVYVTFEQAKLLKEKGFDITTSTEYWYGSSFNQDGDVIEQLKSGNIHKIREDESFEIGVRSISRPEQWQVVEWLRVKHSIWVYVKFGYMCEYIIQSTKSPFNILYTDGTLNSPQEAYSEAFDYILKNLI